MRVVSALLVATTAIVAAPASAQDEAALEAGREVTALALAGEAEALARRLSPDFLEAIGGLEGLKAFLEGIAAQAGAEQDVLSEQAFRENGTVSYYRRSRFARMPDVTTAWTIDAAGTITSGSVRPTPPPAPSDYLDYRTRAHLRLPFAAPGEGAWYVRWGGRDLVHNYHVAFPDQRFAYDLLVTREGRPYRTDGKTAADYYCFGLPILAPAAGKVVEAVDGLPDNPPGTMDRQNPVGNHVIIDHGHGEFSFMAHFQQGSVRPRKGDRVRAGEPVGRCGNSGNTSMPHLHYHLQTTRRFADGEGLPAPFNDYVADGVPVARGEPVRGQTLLP